MENPRHNRSEPFIIAIGQGGSGQLLLFHREQFDGPGQLQQSGFPDFPDISRIQLDLQRSKLCPRPG
jgi:hypothetical protein